MIYAYLTPVMTLALATNYLSIFKMKIKKEKYNGGCS